MDPETKKGISGLPMWAGLAGGMAVTAGLLYLLARGGFLGRKAMKAKDFETEAEEFVEQMVGWLPSGHRDQRPFSRARWVAQTAEWLRMDESGLSILVLLRDRLFAAWERGRDYGLQKGKLEEREELRKSVIEILDYHALYIELREGKEEAAPIARELRALSKIFDQRLRPKREWEVAGGETKGIWQAPLDSQPEEQASP